MSEPQLLGEKGRKHGKPASWTLVAVVILSFTAGGVALILGAWVVFYVCAGVFALCVPVGALIGIMDDTVQWTLPPQSPDHRHRVDRAHSPTQPTREGDRQPGGY